jgi:hypothetical protein
VRKSLEEFGATDGNGKLWLRDVEKVHSILYRYASWLPEEVDGVRKLGVHPSDGWYVSPSRLNTADEAIGKLQLPISNPRPIYRIEIETSGIKNNVRCPRGQQDKATWLESLTKDYNENPDFGQPGGDPQLLIDGSEVVIRSYEIIN